MFYAVRDRYKDVFSATEEITASNSQLAIVISQLQQYSFIDSPHDVIGTAYEIYVASHLKGERGQYFTNMLLGKDGHGGIEHANSLDAVEKLSARFNDICGVGKPDIILTNPPFGSGHDSVIFLQKKVTIEKDYKIFMAISNKVGQTSRGGGNLKKR